MSNLIILTTGQTILAEGGKRQAASGKRQEFLLPVVYAIILLNPFGEQAQWIPANPYAFSGTL